MHNYITGDTKQEKVYQNLMLNTLDTPAGLGIDDQARRSISDASKGVYEELNKRILHENTYSTLSARRAYNATSNMVIKMAAYHSNTVLTDASTTSEYEELGPDLKSNAEYYTVLKE